MADSTATASVNAKMGVFGWLTILFVVLKLDPGNHLSSPVEDWSWWLVLLPLYFWFVVFLVVVIIGASVVGIAELLDRRDAKKRRKARLARLNK